MEQKHNIMLYRQDLPGYFEPAIGAYDGFARINCDTFSGGIVGFFRHGAKESTRKVCVDGLLEDREYLILDMDGKEIARMSGASLEKEGFDVTIEENFGGRLFEITLS